MAVKIFFKHLLTSIRKRPAQPLILILIVAVAVDICILALNIKDYLYEEKEQASWVETGRADLTVSLSALSDSSFISIKDAQKALEGISDNAVVCGVFGLPLYYGEDSEFLYGIATDFKTICTLFDIGFSEIIPIPDENLGEAILVSQSFAQENHLGIGDTVPLKALGFNLTYRIYGISADPFLNTYDIMVASESVTSVMFDAPKSVAIKVLAEDFLLAGKLYVYSDGHTEEALSALSDAIPFSNVTVTHADVSNSDQILTLIVILIVISGVLFSFCVLYCCFSILSAQRKEENDLLYSAGAKNYMLGLVGVSEMFLYWLIGSLIGIGCAYPLSSLIIDTAHFVFCQPTVSATNIAISLAVVLASSESGMVIYLVTDWTKKHRVRKEKKEIIGSKTEKKILIAIPSGALLFSILGTVLHSDGKLVTGVIATVSFFAYAFIGGKSLFVYLSKFLSSGRIKKNPLRYGIKNSARVRSLSNTMGLFAVFLLVDFALVIFLSCGESVKKAGKNFLKSDYIVAGINASSLEAISETNGVENAYGVLMDTGFYNGKDVYVLSFSDIGAVDSQYFPLERLPKGKEVILCTPNAKKLGLKEDSSVALVVGGQTFDLTMVDTVDFNGEFFIVDGDYWGMVSNYAVVQRAENCSHEQLFENLTDSLAFESATIIEPEDFISQQEWETYILCLYFVLASLSLFAIVGMLDSVISAYRSRQEEFACYRSAGMSSKEVQTMKLCETGYSFLCGIGVALILAGFVYWNVYEMAMAFSICVAY